MRSEQLVRNAGWKVGSRKSMVTASLDLRRAMEKLIFVVAAPKLSRHIER